MQDTKELEKQMENFDQELEKNKPKEQFLRPLQNPFNQPKPILPSLRQVSLAMKNMNREQKRKYKISLRLQGFHKENLDYCENVSKMNVDMKIVDFPDENWKGDK